MAQDNPFGLDDSVEKRGDLLTISEEKKKPQYTFKDDVKGAGKHGLHIHCRQLQ